MFITFHVWNIEGLHQGENHDACTDTLQAALIQKCVIGNTMHYVHSVPTRSMHFKSLFSNVATAASSRTFG